jgi:hypothetical protein
MADKIDRIVKQFQTKYKQYKDWTFEYEYPGYMAYYNSKIPFSVYFTPDFNGPNEVSIQINYKDDPIDGGWMPFYSYDADDLHTMIKPWLDYVVDNVVKSRKESGVLEWRPDVVPWQKRGE